MLAADRRSEVVFGIVRDASLRPIWKGWDTLESQQAHYSDTKATGKDRDITQTNTRITQDSQKSVLWR
jgi:hypothetical protein